MLHNFFDSLFPTSRCAWRELPGGVPTPRATWGAVCHASIDHAPIGGQRRQAPVLAVCLAIALLALLSAFTTATQAGDLNVPHSFTAGTPALAAKVNANFSAVETAVDDNDARIAALEALVVTLQSKITTLQNQHNSQQTAINAIQGSNVMGIDPYIELTDIIDPNNATPYATVRLSGVNLQVVNGTGDTSTTNGLGNVIVGYNELDTATYKVERCSDGRYDTGPDCVFNGGVWAFDHRSGSHAVVVGKANSYSSYGNLLAGNRNLANKKHASVTGGLNNTASGQYSVVSGGNSNRASGSSSVVSGGLNNDATFANSTVSGGASNAADGYGSSVSGGSNNTAAGTYSSVSGGAQGTAPGDNDWRAGSLFEDH